MLRAPVVGSVFESTQENYLPATQDYLWECHPTSSGPVWKIALMI
jgi:hypothetical protein